MNNMKDYKIGDQVRVVTNELASNKKDPFHYFELGETVRVFRVCENLIYCRNRKGLEQGLRKRHIEPIEKQ